MAMPPPGEFFGVRSRRGVARMVRGNLTPLQATQHP
ncbi:hypothetical protein STIB_70660 [Streptomyces sp. IB2014 011-1]|nr:hypothetical protein STIB_70660 [Streptomyces sp. IB2014 011-1]